MKTVLSEAHSSGGRSSRGRGICGGGVRRAPPPKASSSTLRRTELRNDASLGAGLAAERFRYALEDDKIEEPASPFGRSPPPPVADLSETDRRFSSASRRERFDLSSERDLDRSRCDERLDGDRSRSPSRSRPRSRSRSRSRPWSRSRSRSRDLDDRRGLSQSRVVVDLSLEDRRDLDPRSRSRSLSRSR